MYPFPYHRLRWRTGFVEIVYADDLLRRAAEPLGMEGAEIEPITKDEIRQGVFNIPWLPPKEAITFGIYSLIEADVLRAKISYYNPVGF